jgi:glycosyltransferase involved in cell wall biosynthesis
MKIAIEAQRIFRANKHGMDFVALESIRQLQKIDKENEYYIFVSPGPDRCLEESANVHIIELNCPTYPLWEQLALPAAVHKLQPHLLHCTSNTAPLRCPVPLVLTLHDIIFLESRQSTSKSLYQEMGWHYRRLVVPRILSKCSKIITVSQFECQRIRTALHLPEKQITAVYNGYNTHFTPQKADSNICRKYIDTEDFLFFLGNTDPKKNAARVLKAYSMYLQRSTRKQSLLIADLKEEYIDKLLANMHIEEIKPYLRFPGYIPNKDLAALYNGAFAFLYPSMRESFGIPILEAMACGTPVITGNTSAMPEIAGDGALLVDPYMVEEIAEKVLLLENDADLYQQQVSYGLQRVKLFSWEATAHSLLHIYREVAMKEYR